MTTLIKDLINIPDRVQRGDFVLRLSEGVQRAEETLGEYVVTPESWQKRLTLPDPSPRYSERIPAA